MKTLYIAEKPDIGRAIAEYLWPDGYKKTKCFLQHGDTTVTWAFGHILKTAEPEKYGEQFKTWSNYPIFPEQWIMQPDASKKEQLQAIGELLKTHDVVVHGGDPDREGQLLIDEILAYFNYKGTVKRILINAKDAVSMKRAFEQIEDNEKYKPLYHAGMGREQLDWLIGMNLTRAYTVSSRKHGWNQVFHIGRVKVPTLALVVRREEEIQQFTSQTYFELIGHYQKDGISFAAKRVPKDAIPTDSEGRVLDKAILQTIKTKVSHDTAVVQSVEVTQSKTYPPLPYSLDTLQVAANKKHGYSPKQVLDTVQELYEHKFVSYPRSDCNYLPVSQQQDAGAIISMLQDQAMEAANSADITHLSSKCWNDKKITAHHAIIPTSQPATNLTAIQQTIYDMIALRYCIQFMEPAEYDKAVFTITSAGETFRGTGSIQTKAGFTRVFHDDESADEHTNMRLPALSSGDSLTEASYTLDEKKTKPPKRFTEGTLLAAMANIYKYMSKDNPMREKLKEIKGIGTPATRDTIISELQLTQNKGKAIVPYMEKKKKELVPTEWGRTFIHILSDELTRPDATAEMEYALAEIAANKKDLTCYIKSVTEAIKGNITYAESKAVFPVPPNSMRNEKQGPPCPVCETEQLVQRYSKKTNSTFWVCPKSCVHPGTGKTIFYDDVKGKPAVKLCPTCSIPMLHRNGQYGAFWSCPTCKKNISDKPTESKKAKK